MVRLIDLLMVVGLIVWFLVNIVFVSNSFDMIRGIGDNGFIYIILLWLLEFLLVFYRVFYRFLIYYNNLCYMFLWIFVYRLIKLYKDYDFLCVYVILVGN